MITVIRENNPKARKDHDCMACDFVLAYGIDGNGFLKKELRILAKARRNKWNIIKGDKYLHQVNVYDGRIYDFRAIPEVHQICLDNKLYYE